MTRSTVNADKDPTLMVSVAGDLIVVTAGDLILMTTIVVIAIVETSMAKVEKFHDRERFDLRASKPKSQGSHNSTLRPIFPLVAKTIVFEGRNGQSDEAVTDDLSLANMLNDSKSHRLVKLNLGNSWPRASDYANAKLMVNLDRFGRAKWHDSNKPFDSITDLESPKMAYSEEEKQKLRLSMLLLTCGGWSKPWLLRALKQACVLWHDGCPL